MARRKHLENKDIRRASMKRILIAILIALTGVAFALPLSVELEAGLIFDNKEQRFLDQRSTLHVEIFEGFSLGFSVGLVEGDVATGLQFKYAYPSEGARITGRAGVWQFDEAMGYIGIGGEIPLKHITFGIGADVGWSRTRSFVCPSAWIVLN